jgi:hypothetical protein
MNEQQNIEETLWNYIDGSMNAEELSFVEKLVQTDAAWKTKYAELMDVHTLMKDNIELDQPSLRFTQNVMEEISRLYISPAASNYINKNIIRGIGIFFLTMIIGLLGYSFGQIDWSEPGTSPVPTYNISNVDWSKLFNTTYMNIFIMVNIVLGLMLLDMYLTKKKKEV